MIKQLLRRWLLKDRDPPAFWLRPDQSFPVQTILALRTPDEQLIAEWRERVSANELKRRQRRHVAALMRDAGIAS